MAEQAEKFIQAVIEPPAAETSIIGTQTGVSLVSSIPSGSMAKPQTDSVVPAAVEDMFDSIEKAVAKIGLEEKE